MTTPTTPCETSVKGKLNSQRTLTWVTRPLQGMLNTRQLKVGYGYTDTQAAKEVNIKHVELERDI